MFVDAMPNVAVLPPRTFLHNSVHIGGITLELSGESPDEVKLNDELLAFADDTHSPDIQVHAQFVDELKSFPVEPRFNSGALWRVFSQADSFTFDFVSDLLGADPYKRLVVDRTFSSAQLLLSNKLLAPHAPIFPLEYPTDELLITNYLASRRLGVEVHGCGLIDSDAGGQLFLGHSGAGKSTTTRIWQSTRNPFILSDDRIILRLEDGKLRMYGTPWHGEAAFAEQGNASINRIFILQHGAQNRIRILPKAEAVGEIFARSFPPFHSAEGLEGTLEFINRALDTVPCYEFQFVPDRSAIETALGFHD
jgi:hypothetical protein